MIWVVSGSADGSPIIGNAQNYTHFLVLGFGMGGAGGPKIIGNVLNSMHFHCLGGVAKRKYMELHTFPRFGCCGGGRGQSPESLEMHRFLYTSMALAVVGGAQAVPQSLEIQRTPNASMVWRVVWVARAGPEIIGGAEISMRFHGLARAMGCVGGTGIIAQAPSNAGGVGTQTNAQS